MAVGVTRTQMPQLQVRLRGKAKPSLGPSQSTDRVGRKCLRGVLSPDSHSCSSAEPAPAVISEIGLLVQLCVITLPLCLSVCNSSAPCSTVHISRPSIWRAGASPSNVSVISSSPLVRVLGQKPCRKRDGSTDSAQGGPGSLGTWDMELLAMERAQLIHINIQG